MSGFSDFAAGLRAIAERMDASLAVTVAEKQAQQFLWIEKVVTPKRSGALAASEIVNSVSGGGAFATANVGPHRIYAKFRNDGGTINAKDGGVWKTGANGKSRMYRHTLYFDGTFAMHVTQAGAHYIERAEEMAAGGALDAMARSVLDEFMAG